MLFLMSLVICLPSPQQIRNSKGGTGTAEVTAESLTLQEDRERSDKGGVEVDSHMVQ